MRYRTTITNKEDNSVGYLDYVWVDNRLISITFTGDGVNQTAKYIYNEFNEPIGFIATEEDGSVDTFYYLKNAQGDITHIVSAAGKKMVSFTYDAFGKRTVAYQANNSTTPGQIELLTQMKADLLNPFAYRGYCYDYDMGMYYLQSRYYDPEVGRFINSDSTEYLNYTGTVLSCNLFAYCENDPVNFVDPQGTYAGTLNLYMQYSIISTLVGALPKMISGIKVSMASIKAAITTATTVVLCIAAVSVAIISIIYVINKIIYLTKTANKAISAVKARINAKGVNPRKLSNYTVYVITIKGTLDVVYVGITKNYAKRYYAHTRKRFPPKKYTMLPIATNLSKTQARALEQTIITAYGLITLVNMINSISPKKWNYFRSEFNQMQTLIESWYDPE